MKLYTLVYGETGEITVQLSEGERCLIDERDTFSSFPKAKKAAVEGMRAHQGVLKQAIADLRAAKNYEAL